MLQTIRGGPWEALSPDVIVLETIESSDCKFQQDKKQIIFMEIKIRKKPTTIQHAYAAREKYGVIVYCGYGGDYFKDCVLSDNRKQLLQQAMVTDLQ
jgi:hypothetical protein